MSDSELSVDDYKRLLRQSEQTSVVMYLDARRYLEPIDPDNETHTFVVTMDVFELACRFKDYPISDCDACFSRSLLKPGRHERLDAMLCAWDEGCE